MVRLSQQLDDQHFRFQAVSVAAAGGLFSRGHIYKTLSNPIYVGRIAHKGQVYDGHHLPVVTGDTCDRVQQTPGDHLGAARTKRKRGSSDVLLAGELYDYIGDRTIPTWTRQGRNAGAIMYLRRFCKVPKAKLHQSCAFQQLMSKSSSLDS